MFTTFSSKKIFIDNQNDFDTSFLNGVKPGDFSFSSEDKTQSMILAKSYSDTIVNSQLFFLLKNKSEFDRLEKIVNIRNQIEYLDEKPFQFVKQPIYDKEMAIIGIPGLGLGAFSCRSKTYMPGDIITMYPGVILFKEESCNNDGIYTPEQLQEKIKLYKGSGSYVIDVKMNKEKAFAIDGKDVGGAGRFINAGNKPNVKIAYIYGRVCFIAISEILFGEEFITDYGPNYFDEQCPYVSHDGLTLQFIFSEIFRALDIEETLTVNNIDEVEKLISRLNIKPPYENLIGSTETVSKEQLCLFMPIPIALHQQCELYLDENKLPRIYQLQNNVDIQRLSKTEGLIQFTPTSKIKLIVAPASNTIDTLNLMAGQFIQQGSVICQIIGEEIQQSELDICDSKYLFLHKSLGKSSFYCKHVCSESRFIEGASDLQTSNAKIHLYTIRCGKTQKKVLSFIASKDIFFGDPIISYFGDGYLAKKALPLLDMMNHFNHVCSGQYHFRLKGRELLIEDQIHSEDISRTPSLQKESEETCIARIKKVDDKASQMDLSCLMFRNTNLQKRTLIVKNTDRDKKNKLYQPT